MKGENLRKLVLLLDEWNNDKNFVGSEIELLKSKYEVTVICNDFAGRERTKYPQNVCFVFYKRRINLHIFKALLLSMLDIETWKEFRRALKEEHIIKIFSEIIRFHINSELFYYFLKENDLVEKDQNTIYYSYWYFWKCYSITSHKKEIGKCKAITRTHEYDLYNYSIPSKYQPFKCAMDSELDKVIFIAEHGLNYYLKKYNHINSDKYLLYHLGTFDYKRLNPYVRGNEVVLVSCSSLIQRKRIHLIIEALERIKNVYVKWIHFGTGELESELRMSAKLKLDHKNNIEYNFMGYTSHEEIMKFYMNNSIDAFVMTAISEGNPVSVMESMSFGIPIISANICNMNNLIKNNGILIDEIDSEKLAYKICEFANLSDDIIMKIRKGAYLHWYNNYRSDKNDMVFVDEVIGNL